MASNRKVQKGKGKREKENGKSRAGNGGEEGAGARKCSALQS